MDSIFREYNVIFTHCFTINGLAGNAWATNKSFYDRIDDVIKNKFELSCSTIKRDDKLNYPVVSNFCGPVGIILKNINITYANPGDGGTLVTEYGKRDFELLNDTSPTEQNIRNAIINRSPNSYNEFCAVKYQFFGFFLCFDDMNYLRRNIISEEIFFNKTKGYKLDYFNLSHGRLFKSNYDPQSKGFQQESEIEPSEIY